jgi:hypothetical protein
MRLVDISVTLPPLPTPFVARDNVIATIETIFGGHFDTVIVQGPDGIGKSTLLTSYAHLNPERTLSLFVNQVRMSYELSSVINELGAQALAAVGKDPRVVDETLFDQSGLGALFHQLARRARRGSPVVFVVDGLEEIWRRDKVAAQEIVDLLPFGRQSFRFIFSGHVEDALSLARPAARAYPLTLFSYDESRAMLDGLDLSAAQVQAVHRACNGLPGQIAAVRRLVLSGHDTATIISRQLGDLGSTMEMEWSSATALPGYDSAVLATLAFDSRRHTSTTLAQAAASSADVVRAFVERVSFLAVTDDDRVDFLNDNFRRFAQSRLQHLKKVTLDRLVEMLFLVKDSREAVTTLPHLLTEARQHDTLIGLMEPAYIERVIGVTESLAPIADHTALAIRAAEDVGKDGELFRFALLRAILSDVQNSGDRVDEVSALVASGEWREAVGIARSAVLREHRLQLMAVALAAMIEKGTQPDESLLDELRQLCRASHSRALSDNLIGIAADVLFVAPDAAIELVERYAAETNTPGILDSVLAALSLRSLRGSRGSAIRDHLESVSQRISDQQIKNISRSATLLGSGMDVLWVLEKAETIQSASDRITFFRLWCELNNRKGDAVRIAQTAVDLAITTPEYSLSISVLRQLASTAPYSTDVALAKQLVGAIDAQLRGVTKSPALEYTRLQLLLARAEVMWDRAAAKSRVTELYFFITEIEDLAVRAEALARLFAKLGELEPGSHDDVKNELCAHVDQVLSQSADHVDTLLPIVTPIVATHAALALAMVGNANTEARRDECVSSVAEEIARSAPLEHVGDLICVALDRVTDPHTRVEALSRAAVSLAKRNGSGGAAKSLLARALQISSAEQRATTLADLLSAIGRDAGAADRSLVEQLKSALERIDSPTARIRVGFRVTRLLCRIDERAGKEVLRVTNEVRTAVSIPPSVTWPYLASLKLAVRAIRGLSQAGRDCEEEVATLVDAAALLPEVIHRLWLLQEVAFWLHEASRTDLRDRVFHPHISRALEEARSASDATLWKCLTLIAPVLYRKNVAVFHHELSRVPESVKEDCIASVIFTFIRGVPAGEPYQDAPGSYAELTYETCVEVLTLLDHTGDDHLIFWAMRAIVDATTSRDTRITAEQRSNLHKLFEKLIDHKLPSARFITHLGFKVACIAQSMRLEGARGIKWRQLAFEAKQINNIPDRAYTLLLVGSSMPPRESVLRDEIVADALAVAGTMAVATEKFECFVGLAREMATFDNRMAQRTLKSAMGVLMGLDLDADDDRYRRLLDVAYGVDPEFATLLASEMDSDSARRKARDERLDAAEVLRARRRLMTEDALGDGEEISVLAEASWGNLGALNSGAVAPRRSESLRPLLRTAATGPLTVSYPMFAWVLQNLVQRHSANREAALPLRGMVHAGLICAQLSRTVGRLTFLDRSRELQAAIAPAQQKTWIIQAGERRQAIARLRHWCRNEVAGYLKIVDQFFGPEDMDFIQLVAEELPGVSIPIQVLTSSRHLKALGAVYQESFLLNWQRLSDEAPPDVEIVIAGIPPDGRSPIHDRWWITRGAALDFGTSHNSLGVSQDSEVQPRDAEDAVVLESQADKYLNRIVRWVDAGRISYTVISL